MNILARLGSNVAGLLSPSPAQKAAAAADVISMAKANILGRITKASNRTKATSTDASSQELGQDAFLRLLMTQIQYQDPLEPVDNADMLAQLAQFASLEQMNNLNDATELLSGNIDQLNFITANSLLGRTVSGIDVNGQPISGLVEKVHLDGSLVYLTVGGQLMSMAGVLEIA